VGVAGILDAGLWIGIALVVTAGAAREIPPHHRVKATEIHRRRPLALRAFDLALYIRLALDHMVLHQVVALAVAASVVVEDRHLFLLLVS